MEIINLLQEYKLVSIPVIFAIIPIMIKLRKQILDELLLRLKYPKLRFLILALIALVLSIVLTFLVYINKFDLIEWIKLSMLNWIWSWVFFDIVKKIFTREEE